MEAGAEMDVMVAETVMGWHMIKRVWANGEDDWCAWTDYDPIKHPGYSGAAFWVKYPSNGGGAVRHFNPSTDLRATHMVLGHLRTMRTSIQDAFLRRIEAHTRVGWDCWLDPMRWLLFDADFPYEVSRAAIEVMAGLEVKK